MSFIKKFIIFLYVIDPVNGFMNHLFDLGASAYQFTAIEIVEAQS